VPRATASAICRPASNWPAGPGRWCARRSRRNHVPPPARRHFFEDLRLRVKAPIPVGPKICARRKRRNQRPGLGHRQDMGDGLGAVYDTWHRPVSRSITALTDGPSRRWRHGRRYQPGPVVEQVGVGVEQQLPSSSTELLLSSSRNLATAATARCWRGARDGDNYLIAGRCAGAPSLCDQVYRSVCRG